MTGNVPSRESQCEAFQGEPACTCEVGQEGCVAVQVGEGTWHCPSLCRTNKACHDLSVAGKSIVAFFFLNFHIFLKSFIALLKIEMFSYIL